MKMLFVADLHYALKQFDWLIASAANYNPVIIGGDLLDLGSVLDADIQIMVIEKYLYRLRQHTSVVVCSGNHDLDGCNAAGEAVASWLHDVKAENLFVDGTSVELSGALLTICPWWDGAVSRAKVEADLARQAGNSKRPWIWVYHAPPAGSAVSWNGTKFAGDEFLRESIIRFGPDLVLSGHIHNAPFYEGGSWIDRIGKTWVFNVGRQPGPWPTYIVLDPDTMAAKWTSFEKEAIYPLRQDISPR
jgi:Icc-related predicted phosphoesterase